MPSLGLLQLQEPKAQGWQHVQCAAGVPTHSTGCGWTQDVWCFLHPQGQTPVLNTVTELLLPTGGDGGISSQEQALNVTMLVKRRIYYVGVHPL